MHVFGLTGGIASGKSTVAAVFRAEGVPVVDADELAREVVEPGQPALEAIVAAFGPEVLQADGTLDRKRVAAIVFADDEARARLNGIIHPAIAAASAARFARLAGEGHPLVCYDAALIVERGIVDAFRPLVVVAADPALQRARLVARDGASEAEAAARVAAQAPVEAKIAAADVVIHNDADLATLQTRAREALAEVRRRVAS
ncbi:MAG: dephospho-CoA kinase [Deltaproteobacteria bacterium]|nr:dephospho-CoA kinase [Deltaproteobacteria bacterium]